MEGGWGLRLLSGWTRREDPNAHRLATHTRTCESGGKGRGGDLRSQEPGARSQHIRVTYHLLYRLSIARGR
jgi:hypothetical protein